MIRDKTEMIMEDIILGIIIDKYNIYIYIYMLTKATLR